MAFVLFVVYLSYCIFSGGMFGICSDSEGKGVE